MRCLVWAWTLGVLGGVGWAEESMPGLPRPDYHPEESDPDWLEQLARAIAAAPDRDLVVVVPVEGGPANTTAAPQ